jgi:hypothetical protein
MSVHTESGIYPKTEVARGNAIPLNPQLQKELGIALDATSRFPEQQIAWDELLARLPLDRAVAASAPLPGDGRTLPMLELTPAPPREGLLRKEGTPFCRLRVWFDPEFEYCPVRLESDVLKGDGEQAQYVHFHIVEWMEPTRLRGGFVQPLRCALHWHSIFSLPRDDGTAEWFPGKAYNIKTTDVVISDVRINGPLDDAAFAFAPPAGTSVRDEIAEYTYLVGSAGEELEKRAIEERESGVTPPPRRWSAWTKALTFTTGMFVAIALGYVVWRIRRRVREKSR